MGVLVTVLAKLIDPIAFLIVFGISFLSRKKWVIPLAAIAGFIVTETLLTAARETHTWGSVAIPSLLVSGIHATFSYWLIGKIKEARAKKLKASDES